MEDLSFIEAGCGHIITAGNLGGKCTWCGALCCRECLTLIDGEILCPRCLVRKLEI